MGVIVHDTISCETGLELTDVYINIRDGMVTTEKQEDGNFYISASFGKYISYTFRLAGKRPFNVEYYSYNVGSTMPNTSSPYELIYAQYKTQFTSTTDQV